MAVQYKVRRFLVKLDNDFMMKHLTKLIFTILCVLLTVQLCVSQISIQAEEYAIYSDLIGKVYGDDAAKQFAIEKRIDAKFIDSDYKSVVEKLSLDANLVKDFNERNNSTAELENRFNLKSKAILLSAAELKEIFKPERSYGETAEEDWANFRKKYQTFSLLRLSRVGFNKNQDKALVVLGSQYGWLGGDGFYYLLVKKRDGWEIKKKLRAWIS